MSHASEIGSDGHFQEQHHRAVAPPARLCRNEEPSPPVAKIHSSVLAQSDLTWPGSEALSHHIMNIIKKHSQMSLIHRDNSKAQNTALINYM